MTPAHETVEKLANGIVKVHRDLAREIEEQYNMGVLLDECQPLKDKAFEVYLLRGLAKDLLEAIVSDDFDPKVLRENLEKINLQRMLKDEDYGNTEFHKVLHELGIVPKIPFRR